LYQEVALSVAESITLVEQALRDLIRDWERYFAGDLRVPPHAKHERISGRLRSLSQQPPQRRADQLRLEQLQHRFMSYTMNWERMLREREEGRGRFAAGGRAQAAPSHAQANDSPASSVDVGDSGSLYERYVAAKREHGEDVQLDRRAFDAQIATERRKLEGRLGQKVRFDVLIEDGKVKLAARKVRRKRKGT
jgi:5-methylcytosine-specific restriction endonuclease McrA